MYEVKKPSMTLTYCSGMSYFSCAFASLSATFCATIASAALAFSSVAASSAAFFAESAASLSCSMIIVGAAATVRPVGRRSAAAGVSSHAASIANGADISETSTVGRIV